jgi:hypothetical protein
MKRKYSTRRANNDTQKTDTKKTDTTSKKNKGSKNKPSKNVASGSHRELRNDSQELGSDQEQSSLLSVEASISNRLEGKY